MPTLVPFQAFYEAVAEKAHNLGADTLKWALTNSAPNAATGAVLTDITQISAGNGYTAGGSAASITSSGLDAGAYKLVLGDVVVTASGGSIGPLRYAVLYNDTATNDELIGFLDYGSSITLADGETLTIDADASAGVLTIGAPA